VPQINPKSGPFHFGFSILDFGLAIFGETAQRLAVQRLCSFFLDDKKSRRLSENRKLRYAT